MPIIAPSLLASDFRHMAAECKMLNESQADWFHLDIMDGRFVPNISFGPMIVEFFRKATTKICDVHLSYSFRIASTGSSLAARMAG